MSITARSVHLSFTTPPMREKKRPAALFSAMASELWNSTPLILRTLISSYWAACAPSHKMGFRSSVSKSGLPGEGRHEGLVPRNDVLTKGFI